MAVSKKKPGNRKGWEDPNKEGRVLRKIVNKLDKLLFKPLVVTIIEDDDDPELPSKEQQIERAVGNHVDRVVKISHCIAQVAQAKNSMAKTGVMQKDIDEIKDHLGIK